MKRAVTALGAGFLALGLAGSASLVGAVTAGATVTTVKSGPTVTGFDASSYMEATANGGAPIVLNGYCLGDEPNTGTSTAPIYKSAGHTCLNGNTLTSIKVGAVTVPLTSANLTGPAAGTGNSGTQLTFTAPATNSGDWVSYGSTISVTGDASYPVVEAPIAITGGSVTLSNPSFGDGFNGFDYVPDQTGGTITVNHETAAQAPLGKSANLSLTKSNVLSVTGSGWSPGMSVLVTICNADASLPSPLGQLQGGSTASTACAPVQLVTGPGGNAAAISSTSATLGTFSWSGSLVAGLVDPSPNGGAPFSSKAVCPMTVAQADEGVACIIGVAETTPGFNADGNTANGGLFFAAPPLTSTDSYLTGLGANAEYAVTLANAGDGAATGYPPVVTAKGVPTFGGFATQGVICTGGTTAANCTPSLTAGKPTSCQASSTGNPSTGASGGTSWTPTESTCTFGAALGEPIALLLTAYAAPLNTSDTSPITPSAQPFNCEPGVGCSISANAGYGAANPGGFTAPLEYYNGGTSGTSADYSPLYLTPGKYTFDAVGTAYGESAITSVNLLQGPAS